MDLLNCEDESSPDYIRRLIQPGDKLILDRGFRSAVEALDDLGVEVHMPAFMPDGDRQLSTELANATRQTTKLRFAVECVNGRVKKWKLLPYQSTSAEISHCRDNLRIVAALCNAYKPPLASSRSDDDELAARMEASAARPNSFHTRCRQGGDLHAAQRSKHMPMDACDIDFPKLTEAQITSAVTYGVTSQSRRGATRLST